MKKTFRHIAAATVLGAMTALPAQAASISYFLDQSDKLADGVNYLKVTISEGLEGAIDFKVEALQPLLDLAGWGTGRYTFGIDKFAFNVIPEGRTVYSTNVEKPPGWVFGPNQRMGDFGTYNARIRTTNYKDPVGPTVEFSIVGIDYDTILTYVNFAKKEGTQGPSLFAAHVQGLNLGGCNFAPTTNNPGSPPKCKTDDAFFGGAQAVPAPAGVWLLATAVVALAGRRLRQRR